MFTVKNGSVCLLLWDQLKRKWIYIRESRWLKMSSMQKARYSTNRI